MASLNTFLMKTDTGGTTNLFQFSFTSHETDRFHKHGHYSEQWLVIWNGSSGCKEGKQRNRNKIYSIGTVQPKRGIRVQKAIITVNEWQCQRTSAATDCGRAENSNGTTWSPGCNVNLEISLKDDCSIQQQLLQLLLLSWQYVLMTLK